MELPETGPITVTTTDEVARLLRRGREVEAQAMAQGVAAYHEKGAYFPMEACCPYGPTFPTARVWWEHGWRRAERQAASA